MLTLYKALAGMVVSGALLGCASTHSCGGGQMTAVQDLVYLGTDTPAGPVPAAAWAAFLSETVTPRFPAGFTVWPAAGQWRSANGAIVKESSFVLSLVHAGDDTAERAVRDVIETYKTHFQQEAVLRVRVPICMSL